MLKHILLFFFFLFSCASTAIAKNELDLTVEHGRQLTLVDFDLKHLFFKTTKVEWKRSTYEQREAFLRQWHHDQEEQLVKARSDAKERERQEKEKLRLEKVHAREELDKERARLREEKEESLEKKRRERNFKRNIARTGKTIKRLRTEQSQSKR